MVRLASRVLLVWALIMQPLVAAMPMQVTDSIGFFSTMEINSESSTHIKIYQSSGIASLPCHQTTASQKPVSHCDNCNIDCNSNSLCASSCVLLGAAAIQKMVLNLAHKNNILLTTPSNAAIYGLPSRIFHPPKPV